MKLSQKTFFLNFFILIFCQTLVSCSAGPSSTTTSGTITIDDEGAGEDRGYTITFDAPIDVTTVTSSSLFIVPDNRALTREVFDSSICNHDLAIEATVDCTSSLVCIITPTNENFDGDYVLCASQAIRYLHPDSDGIFAGYMGFITLTGESEAPEAETYTIGGTVSGLTGTVVLQNNASDNLTLTANGSFTFSTALADGESYAVTVLTQPDYQACTIENGTGTASSANVSNVMITCSTDTYSVGGTVIGLIGTVVLQNNGADNLSVTENASFTFATTIAVGAGYSVTIQTQPDGQTCVATHASGVMTAANVTNVDITCTNNNPRIFVTSPASASGGDFDGSAAVADAVCESDANYPGVGTYKAMLVDPVMGRLACTSAYCGAGGPSEHVDWVLEPDTTYVRIDGTTIIGTTNSNALLTLPLTNSFSDELVEYWTGLKDDWMEHGHRCANWTSSNSGDTGAVGVGSQTNASSFGGAPRPCNGFRRLLCIEQ